MGLLDRLFNRRDVASTGNPVERRTEPQADGRNNGRPRVTMSIDAQPPDLVKLAGTTTVAKDAMTQLAQRHGIAELGHLEIDGTLVPEPDNPVDPNAVAVHIEGERVGYLPGYLGRDLGLQVGTARPVKVQVFTQLLPKALRAEAWAWLGNGTPKWEWSEQNRPPMTSAAKNRAQHEGRRAMVRDAMAGGGERAAQFDAGSINGIHYLELVEPIKQLKREGRLEEALTLAYVAIDGAEAAARKENVSPAPFYTEQAAIIMRKLGNRDGEISVLTRYVDACPPKYRGNRLEERLAKLSSTA